MTPYEILEEMRGLAHKDPALRERLIATHESADPVDAFCRECQAQGFDLYPMELIEAGEEAYAAYRRSTNGGGENAPKLYGQDDFYEMFIVTLKQM